MSTTAVNLSPTAPLHISSDDDVTVTTHVTLAGVLPCDRVHVVVFEHHDGGPRIDVHRPNRNRGYCAAYCRDTGTTRERRSSDSAGGWMRSTYQGTYGVAGVDSRGWLLTVEAGL